MRSRQRLLAFLAVAALLAGAACHDDTGTTAPQPGDSGPRQGGQVIVPLYADLTTVNPYESTGEASEAEVLDLLFPSLMTEQPDYALHPPTFSPQLATSWEFSQDNRTLTFHLRSNARWSDGVPVTAEDVRFTFQVQRDRRVDWPNMDIKDFIDDVEVVDPHTVRFHFTRVYPYQLMDANDGPIIPAHVWGKIPLDRWRTTDFEPSLVTCGPFRLASHTPQQTVVLERDPAYWGNPRPYLQRLILRVIPDTASQINQLIAGDIQLMPMVPPGDAARIRKDPDLEIVDFPSRAWGFIAWNNRSPLFSDRRVRRALTMAINRKVDVDTIYHGFARLCNGPVLSSFWAYDKNLQVLPYDPEAAKQLLAQAGWRDTNGDGVLDKNGRKFEFDLMYPATNTIRQELGLLVQADLARVGIRVRPLPVEYATLFARQEHGDYQAILAAWEEATKVDLSSEWSTANGSQGGNNFLGYSNPEVDRLIAAAREEPDYTRAKVILDRIQELIVEDQPVTFMYEARQLVGINRRVRGADINAASVFFNVDEWYWAP